MSEEVWHEQLQELREEALESLHDRVDEASLEGWRVQYFGKKSQMTGWSRQLAGMDPEERKAFGKQLNAVREVLESSYRARLEEVRAQAILRQLAAETLDVTLPGRVRRVGTIHPTTRTIEEIETVFLALGFTIAEGMEVETDEYNFEMLNVPKDHPARDMQDTFYLTDELLLRTHTSPMQVRVMKQVGPNQPLKVIVPGRVYRRDEDDATHSHAFTQIEGLVVGEGVRMSDLKGTLEAFAKALFGQQQSIRLRPSFFPFTEPSVEVDVRCIQCQGAGCRICKDTGWIEILGAGMVHPHVLEAAGYDARQFSGFAFGMGPERVAMLKYGIRDIRLLYQNDLRFLTQFSRVLS